MVLKTGSKGDAVKQLQALLGITADGIFGKQTEAAVKAYQKQHGLTVDGIAGNKTLTALGMLEAEVIISCEDIKQFASPHGNMIYGADKTYSTYAQGGCGVTSFAIIYRALGLAPDGESQTLTVQRLGKYSWQHGYRIKGGGTSAGLFNTNGCKRTKINASKIEDSIRSGKLLILHIGAGFKNGYGGKGHYIVAYGIKDNYLLLRDVGSSKASRQKVLLSQAKVGLKNTWEVSKG